METIVNNWFLIVVLICIIAGLILSTRDFTKLPREAQITKVKEWLLYAVVMAEKELGSGTGTLKLRMVYDMFVTKFTWIAKVVTFEQFSLWVDEALERMKPLLESNQNIKNLVNGETE